MTFIGLGQLSKPWLQHLFRVRRQKVLVALQWLQKNNPKYYGNIVIDTNRLSALPDDDIPIEVLSVIRQSTDVDAVVQESAGYVQTDEGEEADMDHEIDDAGGYQNFVRLLV